MVDNSVIKEYQKQTQVWIDICPEKTDKWSLNAVWKMQIRTTVNYTSHSLVGPKQHRDSVRTDVGKSQ